MILSTEKSKDLYFFVNFVLINLVKFMLTIKNKFSLFYYQVFY